MSINLDLIIDTPDHSVDMKSGLSTLQGASDASRLIAETVLTEKTPQRLSHKDKVRTTLKQSFKSSYGHIFSIDIHDDDLKKRFNTIGKAVFAELISYFISESLYKEPKPLSEKGQKIVDKLGESAEELIKQLRVSALENIHDVPMKFEHDVKIRFRKSRDEQTVIGIFNQQTAKVLQATEAEEKIDIVASITRLNINTGNGRLLLKEAEETVAFGFGIEYKAVGFNAKKLFSENLNYNNGLRNEDWKYLRISAVPIKLRDGKIIKYIVKGFYDDK